MDELSQEVLDVIVRGKADSDCYRTFDPVHAEPLVEAPDDAFLPVGRVRKPDSVIGRSLRPVQTYL